ncbi:MAG TPA: hypothetical protein VM165_11105 [Planctomycetaceae bacterium]|nr:hypothetical protein [Planctomycetaceae bacterium]
MFGLFKKHRTSSDFWMWLAANASRIRAGGRNATGNFATEISRAFERSYPDLVWEITPKESGSWVFCVSADGNPDLFEKVRTAVAAAPSIPDWKILAFRQRGSLDAVIEMNGQKLVYNDIWCGVEPDGSRASVTLYVRGLTSESAKTLLGASLVLLDNAVGEHDSVVKISDLDNGPLPANPKRSETFFPLSELPGYLDRLSDFIVTEVP